MTKNPRIPEVALKTSHQHHTAGLFSGAEDRAGTGRHQCKSIPGAGGHRLLSPPDANGNSPDRDKERTMYASSCSPRSSSGHTSSARGHRASTYTVQSTPSTAGGHLQTLPQPSSRFSTVTMHNHFFLGNLAAAPGPGRPGATTSSKLIPTVLILGSLKGSFQIHKHSAATKRLCTSRQQLRPALNPQPRLHSNLLLTVASHCPLPGLPKTYHALLPPPVSHHSPPR